MSSSNGIIVLCICGLFGSIGLRILLPYGQAVIDSCIASFIVTLLLTVKARCDEKFEVLKQMYSNLKLVYYDLSFINHHVMVVKVVSVFNWFDFTYALAKYDFFSKGVRVGDIGKLQAEYRTREASFKTLVEAADSVGCYLRMLVKDSSQLSIFKSAKTGVLHPSYVENLDTGINEVQVLLRNCSDLYSSLLRFINESSNLNNFERFFDNSNRLGSVIKNTEEVLNSLEKDTAELIYMCERRIAKRLGGLRWAHEKKVVDTIAACESFKKSKELKLY